MFLQWKLTSQKISLKLSILTALGILIPIILLIPVGNFCGIQHMQIINEIESYEKSLDPEICELIVEKIDLFNDDCKPYVEILDCG